MHEPEAAHPPNPKPNPEPNPNPPAGVRVPESFKKYLGHPVFNENAIKAQEDLKSRLQGENNTWFTGAWLRYGFHEDGIHSAVEMCKKLLGKDDVVSWMPRFDVEPKQSLLGSAFMSMFQTIAGKWMPPNAKLTFTLPTG